MTAKHIHGYDPTSQSWIVGLATSSGTIETITDYGFSEALEANSRAAELNAADQAKLAESINILKQGTKT